MIYTLTFNPSLDYIVTVPKFTCGVVNRTTEEIIFPGGKGINVSMVLKNLGFENTALGFYAGFTGVRIANLRCKDVVALGRAPYTNWIGQLQAEDEKRVVTAMHLVGMSDYAEKTMDKMSDGECQRIMIARALAQDTPIILLDEPTAFLDLPNRYELCLLLKKLAQTEGKCILFSTHDLDIALSLCDTIMLIDNPQLYSLPTNEMITSGHIERLFRNESVTFDAQAMKIIIK